MRGIWDRIQTANVQSTQAPSRRKEREGRKDGGTLTPDDWKDRQVNDGWMGGERDTS